MSTQLTDLGDAWAVATFTSPGKRKGLGRGPVVIPKGDMAALLAEMAKQADQARAAAGIAPKKEAPVV